MNIGIYTPSLPVLGGGEKYIGKLAEILSRENDVKFIVPMKPDFEKLEERLNIDLDRVSIDSMRNPASLLHGKPAILLNYVNAYRVSRRTKS